MTRQIRIGNPCFLGWDHMEGDDRIRACHHCSQYVRDVTHLDDHQVDRLVRRLGGRVCLRYRPSRHLHLPRPRRRKKRRHREITRWIKAILARSMALGLFSTPVVMANPNDPVIVQTQAVNAPRFNVTIYIDIEDEPLPGSVVTVETLAGSTISGAANEQGYATFSLPRGEYKIKAHFPGFMTIERSLTVTNRSENMAMTFTADDVDEVMEGIIVVGEMVTVPSDSSQVLDEIWGGSDGYADEERIDDFFASVEYGDPDETLDQLTAGVDVNVRGIGGLTPLMLAVYHYEWDEDEGCDEDSCNVFGDLMRFGADVNASTDRGVPVLAFAVDHSSPDVIRELLEAGADPNQMDSGHNTPLMMAAQAGRMDAVEMLIENEVDLNIRSLTGWTALTHALHYDHEEVALGLLRAGAKWEGVDESGRSALHVACLSDHGAVAERLIAFGASLELRDELGRTPFLVAAEYHQLEMMQLLKANGADVSVRDAQGRNAIELARDEWVSAFPSDALSWLERQVPRE